MEALPQINSIVACEPFLDSFSLCRSVLKKNNVEKSFPKFRSNEVNAIDERTKAKNDFCKNNKGSECVVGDANSFPAKAYPKEEKRECNQSDCKNGSDDRVSKFLKHEINLQYILAKSLFDNLIIAQTGRNIK